MSQVQKLALIYALVFFVVVALDFIPFVKDSQGYVFGVFGFDFFDTSLHIFCGIIALLGGLFSTRLSVAFFQAVGLLFLADGVVALVAGNAFLDFSLIEFGTAEYGMVYNAIAATPYLLIGGVAAVIGFYLAQKESFTYTKPKHEKVQEKRALLSQTLVQDTKEVIFDEPQ